MEVLYDLWVYSRIDRRANNRKSKVGNQIVLQKDETHSCTVDYGKDKRVKES